MPSFHHIELNNIGRGKKRVSVSSADGGIKGVLKDTPRQPRNTVELLSSSGDSPISQRSLASTPTHSRPASRRGSRCEDTKNRLFGPAENSPRRVKNLFQSKVFSSDHVDSPSTATKISQNKAIATFTPIRRNPITGEICAIQQSPSRSNSVLLKNPISINGNNSSSLPVTPTFNRNKIITISPNTTTNSQNLSNSSIASSCLSINSQNSTLSTPSQ